MDCAHEVDNLTIVGLQLANIDCNSEAQVDENLELAGNRILSYPKQADLFVLGELYTCGYSDIALSKLDVVSENLGGKSFQFFSAVAKKRRCYICFGFPLKVSSAQRNLKDVYQICQAVVGPTGELVSTYEKMHLCQYGDCTEKKYFTPGSSPCVFQIKGVKIGMAICYDLRFPELFRYLAWDEGADIILHPSCFPKDTAYASWQHFVVTRALENQVYMMSVNRAGSHFGGSMLCQPWYDGSSKTEVERLGDEEGVLELVCDSNLIKKIRKEFSFRKDRHEIFQPNHSTTDSNEDSLIKTQHSLLQRSLLSQYSILGLSVFFLFLLILSSTATLFGEDVLLLLQIDS